MDHWCKPRLHAGAATLLACLLLAACAPKQQAVRSDSYSQNVTISKNEITLAEDDRLPLRKWTPAKPRAVIVALHGFNDYSHAFEMPATYFRKRGIATYAYDQRGFGAAKEVGIWGNTENYTRDLRLTIQALKKKHPGTPIYILGDSMGGAIAIIALTSQEDFPKVDGLILVAPAVWGAHTINPLYRAMLWTMSHTVPGVTVTGKGLKIQASDNIPVLRAMGKDPLIIKETRFDAIYGLVHLMDDAFRSIEKLETPVLLLYGAKDQVIPPRPVKEVIGTLKAPHTVAYYPDGWHLLLRDLKASVIWKDIVSWTRNPKRPLPSGYDKDISGLME